MVLALATPALADAVLPVDGVFGDGGGCAFFMTGEAEGQDFLLLTPDTFQSNDLACYFKSLTTQDDATYSVAVSCSGETDAALNAGALTVRHGDDGYFVTVDGFEERGPLTPCAGTAALFAPQGLQV